MSVCGGGVGGRWLRTKEGRRNNKLSHHVRPRAPAVSTGTLITTSNMRVRVSQGYSTLNSFGWLNVEVTAFTALVVPVTGPLGECAIRAGGGGRFWEAHARCARACVCAFVGGGGVRAADADDHLRAPTHTRSSARRRNIRAPCHPGRHQVPRRLFQGRCPVGQEEGQGDAQERQDRVVRRLRRRAGRQDLSGPLLPTPHTRTTRLAHRQASPHDKHKTTSWRTRLQDWRVLRAP